jgi:hypothetical protein
VDVVAKTFKKYFGLNMRLDLTEVSMDERWAGLLEGLQRPETQADPRNERVFKSTELFLEAGLRIVTKDLNRESLKDSPTVGWSRLTRDLIVREANSLRLACQDSNLKETVRTGEGAFRDRWKREQDYLEDLMVYALLSSRWRVALESARRKLEIGTDQVAAGDQRFSGLISSVAIRNIGVRIRLANYFIFQLALMMDSKCVPVASSANAKVYERHSGFWIAAYNDILQKLNLKLRPGVSVEGLGITFSCLAEGFTVRAAVADDTFDTQRDKRLFAQAVLLLIGGAIDSGDHRSIDDFVDQLPSPQ